MLRMRGFVTATGTGTTPTQPTHTPLATTMPRPSSTLETTTNKLLDSLETGELKTRIAVDAAGSIEGAGVGVVTAGVLLGREREREHPLVTQLTSNVQLKGKKSVAMRLVADALAFIQSKRPDVAPTELLIEAVGKAAPLVKLVSFKQGGKSILTPTPLTPKQSQRQGLVWIIQAARGKRGIGFEQALGSEILNVVGGKSDSLNKRLNVHKMSLQNKSNIVMRDRPLRR